MKKNIFIALLLTLTLVGVLSVSKKTSLNKEKNLVFGGIEIPFSSDPLDYDFIIHQHAFTSVFGRLISVEKNAEIVPMLAKEWSSENNYRIWKFNFRTDLFYSNGDKITIDHFVKSLKRICFIKKNKKSNSGLVEYLKGFESYSKMTDNLEGIKIEGNTLILEFNKEMPDLLTKISFGFYSLAHPSLFDEKDGSWKDKKKVISSGPYEVVKWNKTNFELRLRNNISYVNYEKRIKNIIFKEYVFYKTAKQMSEIDLLIADKNSLMVDESFNFVGIESGLKIAYARCHSWNRTGSVLKSRNVRKWFRSKFYTGLKNGGLEITKNFLPATLAGVKTIIDNESVLRPDFKSVTLLSHTMSFSLKTDENKNKKSIAEVFQMGLANIGQESGAALIQEDTDYSKHDLEINGTGVEYENYIDSVRFMFLSKEGIQLPDENGKIIKELFKKNPDINLINKEIWDQAIIWPIRHYNSGFWFNSRANIDYSEINLNSPAIDFQFMKWN